ncbi:MAG: adenylate kinase [Candidatus Jordarchaeum sp.]|uniref:adenylate kinase n=1 Tax=Candidatus Jordarchaeum sp. TaxID=2823881 RepID=UPI004049ABB5
MAERKGRIFIVTGIPGVGKTTVLDASLEAARASGSDEVLLVNYGTVMFEEAKSKGLVENRDQMRNLPSEVQREVQRLAAEKIAGMAKNKIVIVDTHMLIKTPEGFLPGIPIWVAEALCPNLFILVEAFPEEIAGRRSRDAARNRDLESVKDIDLHQQLCRSAAIACAEITGSTVKIIMNHDGKAEEAAAETVKLFKAFKR